VIVLGGAQTISSGTWIAGVPEMVRSELHGGAGGYSILMVGYAAGSASFNTSMICSSLNRARFMPACLPGRH